MSKIKQPKQLVLTAIDDNNSIWYEQLIPFLLTLQQTNYQGDIAIIEYGLSTSKIEVLKQNGCKVFPATNQYPLILIDRQISAANIAKKYGYDQIALLDCDIWFPQKYFSYFEVITKSTDLFCTYDIWKCSFLFDCLGKTNKEQISEQINQVAKQNGYVWQAGAIVATQQAWCSYAHYVTSLINNNPQAFLMVYGIDSTVLNLYAAQTRQVSYLPLRYNCPPAWGIRQNNDGYGICFSIENEPIEGLHVTRAHRKGGEYSWHQLFPDQYQQLGKKLRIKPYTEYRIINESITHICRENIQPTSELLLKEAFTDGVMNIDKSSNNDLQITASGCSRLVFQNQSEEEVQLYFHCIPPLDFSSCNRIFFKTEGNLHPLPINRNLFITFQAGQIIEFITDELDVESKRITWVFHNTKLY
ncbi:hypothetical protein [Rodentibacter haemolyticus]|uniref:Glycosyltransferase n=1 Tax=Rodentibacter haemolyticus TaxID=2778911 RepID=A0ABX6UX75_9PAST|nr:hypothetical protein [Rodentibacter haemolyticus]QPB42700.1 hypothetical protein IHV77_00800 [Rodentibacter haemolyticus]